MLHIDSDNGIPLLFMADEISSVIATENSIIVYLQNKKSIQIIGTHPDNDYAFIAEQVTVDLENCINTGIYAYDDNGGRVVALDYHWG